MGARILVVDDLPVNLQLVCDILEFRGHRIDAAASLEEGRRQLRAARPDLVLLDVQMPDGGGEALLREIRNDPALHDLPVIAVTALEDAAGQLLHSGFNGCITKPINTRAFGPAVEAFLK